jgi:hypothetical protein
MVNCSVLETVEACVPVLEQVRLKVATWFAELVGIIDCAVEEVRAVIVRL